MGTHTFTYQAGYQIWTAPEDVEKVHVVINGASTAGSLSPRGAQVTGTLKLGDSGKLAILVGQRGIDNNGATGGAATQGGGGAGGNGQGHNGGTSGGGATIIRWTNGQGSIRAVAGGAGGWSGDRDQTPPPNQANFNGRGGRGGDDGEHGFPGNSTVPPSPPSNFFPRNFGNASGGTQSQAGFGGTNANATKYDGKDAQTAIVGNGGHGGNGTGTANTWGGGGGGGGYRSGGGGQAGTPGLAKPAPGGGGGGGASFIGGLTGGVVTLGGAPVGHGSVTLTWNDPAAKNKPPNIPTQARVNRVDETDGMLTNARGKVRIGAQIDDPDKDQLIRLIIHVSTNPDFTNPTVYKSEWRSQTGTGTSAGTQEVGAAVDDVLIEDNTHYYVRLYTQDKDGVLSNGYNALDFYSALFPAPPDLVSPLNNARLPVENTITFTWYPQINTDQDPATDTETGDQAGFILEWREAPTVRNPFGGAPHEVKMANSADTSWSFDQSNATTRTFKPNTYYEWRVRTKNKAGLWGPPNNTGWSETWKFFVSGSTAAPILISPVNDTHIALPVEGTGEVLFDWEYQDPRANTTQVKADIQWRVVGTEQWLTYPGGVNPELPGTSTQWAFPTHLFTANQHYEWRVRTYNNASPGAEATVPWTALNSSDWSEMGQFWTTPVPGSANANPIFPTSTIIPPPLGCGVNKVYIYERGGQKLIGEITPVTTLQWTRKRDDISTCNVSTNGFGWDCGQRLAALRCMQHELVVFRDGVRVWEGPITRIGYHVDHVEIEAKDVMMYLYRRILRNGYNDSYEEINGVRVGGGLSVVTRATQIIVDALAYDNPNMIEYLTTLATSSDALQGRVVPSYSCTAWEAVDDLAASAGLDYVTVGRRIILWDTHKQIGLLPEMRDGDFSDPPIVTEYGMNLANYFAVTNGTGAWGAVRANDGGMETDPRNPLFGKPKHYGWVEQLSSSYTENADEATVTELTDQADRNIANRWPSPLVVRVPDNTTLNPEVALDINQLVPGVWIPLRSVATLRQVAQDQKLDSVTVSQDESGEKIQVVLSPRPVGRQDSDLDAFLSDLEGFDDHQDLEE